MDETQERGVAMADMLPWYAAELQHTLARAGMAEVELAATRQELAKVRAERDELAEAVTQTAKAD